MAGNDIRNTIDEQPTAYNVNKVVAKLEEKKIDIDGNTSLHYLYSDGYRNGIDYTIDIIRKDDKE